MVVGVWGLRDVFLPARLTQSLQGREVKWFSECSKRTSSLFASLGTRTCNPKPKTCQSSGAVCVRVEVAVLGSPSLIVLVISVDVNQHWT